MKQDIIEALKEIKDIAVNGNKKKLISIIDQYIEKFDSDFMGVYHPFPKEAPFHWRMRRMKELRKQAKIRLERKKTWIYKLVTLFLLEKKYKV